MGDHQGTATFGAGGLASEYRYLLTRDLRPPLMRAQPVVKRVAFIMLNPSSATDELDDPTIRRCIGFGRTLGGDVLEICNLFALRSTQPKALYDHHDPVGPDNDEHLVAIAQRASLLICAWGIHGAHLGRGARVQQMLRDLGAHPLALCFTRSGEPGHPLYVRGDVKPFPIWDRTPGAA